MPDYNCFNKGTFNFEKIGFESEYNHSNRFHQSMKKKLSKFLNKLEFHKAESKFFSFHKKKQRSISGPGQFTVEERGANYYTGKFNIDQKTF